MPPKIQIIDQISPADHYLPFFLTFGLLYNCMTLFRKILLFGLLVVTFSSCRYLRPSIMLKTPKNYDFATISDSLTRENYRISSTDAIMIRLFSNDGFKLVDISSSGGAGNTLGPSIEETVDKEGMLKVPLLGKVKVIGLTLREAQAMLEKQYEEYYKKPYIQLKIVNKRVIVFPGAAGTAQVIPITNNNMTVFEALGYAGGIQEDGKAFRVKLIRTVNNQPTVYLLDLSTIKGIPAGNITVLANDIIYVEPRPRYASKFVQELAPYLTLLTTSLTLILFLKK
jgi:polysaccharide export outer membrane protein